MNARCQVCGTPASGGDCRRCNQQIARHDLLIAERRHSTVGEFLLGLRFAWRGATLTLKSPKLLLLFLTPFLLSAATFGGLVYLAYQNREWVAPTFDTPWMTGLDWLRGPIQSVSRFFATTLLILLAAVCSMLTSSVISAPFLEWISETVESIVFGMADERKIDGRYVWQIWVVPLLQAVVVALLQGGLALFFMAMSLTAVLAPVALVGGAYVISITLVDAVIARKHYPISARFSLPRRNLPLWLGLALPFAFAPYLLSLGVSGATLAYVRERQLAKDT